MTTAMAGKSQVAAPEPDGAGSSLSGALSLPQVLVEAGVLSKEQADSSREAARRERLPLSPNPPKEGVGLAS